MNPFDIGQRFIFWRYSHPPPNGWELFQPGDFGVVIAVDGPDAIRCLPTSWDGEIELNGDTLFCDEVIALRYAPRLSVPSHMRELEPW